MFGSIFMVVSHTLKIAIYVLKSANDGLFYTPLYVFKVSSKILISGYRSFLFAKQVSFLIPSLTDDLKLVSSFITMLVPSTSFNSNEVNDLVSCLLMPSSLNS